MGFNKDITLQHDTGNVGNCNLLVGSHNHMTSIRVRSSDENNPATNPNEQGLLWFMCDIKYSSGDNTQYGESDKHGCQYFLGLTTGRIYQRRITDITIGGGSGKPVIAPTTYHPWKLVSRGDNMTDFIKRPEIENKISDANLLRYSGIFRTHENEGSGETKNLPEGASRWGVLQNFYENDGSAKVQQIEKEQAQTGFQLYAPIDKDKAGSLFIRVKKPQVTWADTPWHELKIHNIIQMQDQVFTHPTQTATNIDLKDANAYHVTTEDTQGIFPNGISKHGIIKTLKTPAGFLRQTYTPLEGDYAGHEFVRTKSPLAPINGERQSSNWGAWAKTNGNSLTINVDKESINREVNPIEYITNAGDKIVYEMKYPQGIKLTEQFSTIVEPVLVKTLIAGTIYDQQGQQQEEQSSFIYQIAYAKEGRQFIREYRHAENTQVDQAGKFGQWKEINTGSGGQSVDINTHLKNMFTHWKDGVTV